MELFMDLAQEILGLGLEPKHLNWLQVTVRGIIMFVAALVMVRLADKRFLARKTAFDAILGFLLASMLARAVNGSARIVPTVVGGFALVFLHRGIAVIASYSERFGTWVKGREEVLIKDGQIQESGMRKNNLTNKDLLEELRLEGQLNDPNGAQLAVMERSGEISVLPKKR